GSSTEPGGGVICTALRPQSEVAADAVDSRWRNCRFPQTAQDGERGTRRSCELFCQTSSVWSPTASASRRPARILRASFASSEATTPTAVLSTPAVSQVGELPGAGSSPTRQAKQGPSPGSTAITIP